MTLMAAIPDGSRFFIRFTKQTGRMVKKTGSCAVVRFEDSDGKLGPVTQISLGSVAEIK